jgi:hypothetical protein
MSEAQTRNSTKRHGEPSVFILVWVAPSSSQAVRGRMTSLAPEWKLHKHGWRPWNDTQQPLGQSEKMRLHEPSWLGTRVATVPRNTGQRRNRPSEEGCPEPLCHFSYTRTLRPIWEAATPLGSLSTRTSLLKPRFLGFHVCKNQLIPAKDQLWITRNYPQ